MQPIATDVARSVVCLSVCGLITRMCPAKTAEPIEMLFEGWLGEPKEPCINLLDEVEIFKISTRRRTVLGSCPANWTALGVSAAVCAAKEIIQSSITAWQPTEMPPTDRCHIELSRWKIRSLRCGVSSKLFDRLLLLAHDHAAVGVKIKKNN